MATKGERFRGSSEIPLTGEGVAAASQLAQKIASRGGLDEIQASSLGRTVHTAKILSHYTHAPITYVGDGLHPWHLGSLEGREITPELLDLQKGMVKDSPDLVVPGRGPLSTADGESFNAFKTRALGKLQDLISKSSTDPNRKIGVVTHYRVKKLLDAWLRKGMNPEGDIDTQDMTTHMGHENPGSIDKLVIDPYAGPQMQAVDLENDKSNLGGGLYFLRHERTEWNRPETT